MRYHIHPIASAKCDSLNEDVLMEETESLDAAKQAAEMASYAYGAGIKDTETGKIDVGFGFGQPCPDPDQRPMPTQSEIERALVLLYRSNNAQDYVNFTRPAGWLDKLPLAGLSELVGLLDTMKGEVMAEANRRCPNGITLAVCGAGICKDDKHDFKGWRDFADGNGGEQVCTECGMGAMAWSLRVGP